MDAADLAAVVERHEKPVLQFSGGKDSLACLWLLKPWWDRITLAWVNTGDAFPETLLLMQRVRELVPHFLEVQTDVKAQIAEQGYPTDVLPTRSFAGMRPLLRDGVAVPMQHFTACCWFNIIEPMQREMQRIGATLIIRGTRAEEFHTTPLRSGDVVDGVEYLFPVWAWSSDAVREYVRRKPFGLPEHYDFVNTSLDCQHCTGHLAENIGKRVYMAQRHPAAHAEVSRRLQAIRVAVASELQTIDWALSAAPERRDANVVRH